MFLLGPPSPELVIDQNGNVVKHVGIGLPTLSGNTFVVPDIVNTSTAAGTATFYVPVWGQDPTPAGYVTKPGEESIQGNASFTFLTAFDHVTITNASDTTCRSA